MPPHAWLALVAWLAVPLPALAQLPSFRVWPDTTPPCNGTLQACIDGSFADDAIDVATNGPIDETLVLNRSLELAAAPGFRPVFAAGRGIQNNPDGGDRFYLIRGFRLLDGSIAISNLNSGLLRAWILDNEANRITVGALDTGGPLSFRIEDNVVTPAFGDLTGILVYATRAFGGGVQTNTVKGNTVELPPTNDAVGIALGASEGSLVADVIGNRVTGSFYAAGIQWSSDASPLSGRIVNNLAVGATDGVGISIGGYLADGVRDFEIVNNTVVGNRFGISAGQRDVRVANNVIVGSETGLSLIPLSGADVSNDHNLFFDNDEDSPNQAPGAGSVFAAPLFANTVDYRPRASSPVVDAGADDALPPGTTTDLAGAPRVLGTVDIGAYEVPEPAAGLAAEAALLALAAVRRRTRRAQGGGAACTTASSSAP